MNIAEDDSIQNILDCPDYLIDRDVFKYGIDRLADALDQLDHEFRNI